MQSNGQRDTKTHFQVAAGRDIGGDTFRKVMQADTQRQQNGRAFDIARDGGNAFLH